MSRYHIFMYTLLLIDSIDTNEPFSACQTDSKHFDHEPLKVFLWYFCVHVAKNGRTPSLWPYDPWFHEVLMVRRSSESRWSYHYIHTLYICIYITTYVYHYSIFNVLLCTGKRRSDSVGAIYWRAPEMILDKPYDSKVPPHRSTRISWLTTISIYDLR
jgi:hypothetical protein